MEAAGVAAPAVGVAAPAAGAAAPAAGIAAPAAGVAAPVGVAAAAADDDASCNLNSDEPPDHPVIPLEDIADEEEDAALLEEYEPR